MQKGFSLIEITVLVGIVGIILAVLIPAEDAKTVFREADTTMGRIERVHHALMGYYDTNGSLPCPANAATSSRTSDFGVAANHDSGDCIDGSAPNANWQTNLAGSYPASFGMVPVRSLGLSNDDAFDGWGRRFGYHVTEATVQSGGAGVLIIQDMDGGTLSSTAAFVLVSHGPNGHGAYTIGGSRFNGGLSQTQELENCDCTSTGAHDDYSANGHLFVRDIRQDTATGTFDDIVTYWEVP